jgi:hypothetical protein
VCDIQWHTGSGLTSQRWKYKAEWSEPIRFPGGIDAGSKTPFEVREFYFAEGPPPPQSPTDHWFITFEFVDCYGIRWIRAGLGQPRRADAIDTLWQFPDVFSRRRAATRLERAERRLNDGG